MEGEGFLSAIAQIAVALAGFSGLVVATRGSSPSGWSRRDIWSLAWMFGTSFGALFLALIPLVLSLLHLRPEVVRAVASLMLAAFMVLFATTMNLFCRRLSKLGDPPRVRYFSNAATALLAIGGSLAALAGLGMFGGAAIGVFAIGLTICLLVSALALVVFLMLFARAARF